MSKRGADVLFHPSPGRTIGVEWELALVDPTSLDLVSAGPGVLDRLRDNGSAAEAQAHLGATITKELLGNTLELVTGVCRDAAEVRDQLTRVLEPVRDAAAADGLAIFGGGSHPFARWEDQEITPGERYQTLIDRTQWWGRQMLIWGVHVHVGVRSAAKVWPLITHLLNYVPHLTALTASSPYWSGDDTGYASNRSMLFQQLPTAGLPFQFDSWAAYQAYLDDVFTTGVIDEVNELRWDIRPSPAIGTIEVRACDGLASVDEIAAVAALIHCLVLDLEDQLDHGTLAAPLPPWHHQENKWRAARYGRDAIVILDADNTEGLVTDDLRRLVDRLEPTARRAGCVSELGGIRKMLDAPAPYERQRTAVDAADGDLRAAVEVMLG